MNLLILEKREISSGYFILKGRKAEHLLGIKNIGKDSKIHAGLLNESRGTFHIHRIEDSQIFGLYTIDFIPTHFFQNTELYISYQRPQTMKKILFLVGMFGITKLVVFRAEKSEKSYESSSLWKDERWREELILGMEQGKNIYFPEIFHCTKKSEVELHLGTGSFWILHPGGKRIGQSLEGGFKIMIGPEGGFSESELNRWQLKGAQKIGLSEIPYRTEYALAGIMSQIELLRSLV